MFIYTQERKKIINSFHVIEFVINDYQEIEAILELPTKTKKAVIEMLGAYDSAEKSKAVMKMMLAEMRKREQTFKMPKNEKVDVNFSYKKAVAQAKAQAQAKPQAAPKPSQQ